LVKIDFLASQFHLEFGLASKVTIKEKIIAKLS